MTDTQHQHWSQFWQLGHITTFGPSLPDNYGGLLRDFWIEIFSRLPQQAQILDIATGNGALATLAAIVSQEQQRYYKIHGTDIATIRPTVEGQETTDVRHLITFTSHTPCESQPFPDHSFDLICSQFGFEYSDIPATLKELRRLLLPQATFTAIAHHENSNLIQESRQELGVYHAAFKEHDIFGRLTAFFNALGDTPANTDLAPAMERAKPVSAQLNEAVNQFRVAHGKSPCGQQMLSAISHLARGASQASGAQRMAAVKAARTDFTLAQQRLVDMTAAALDADDMGMLREAAQATGFDNVDTAEFLVEDNSLAGWRIELS